MDNSAREDWKLDPKNQSGVFLGFAHRRNIYVAQILVDNAIITAKHQIAYDVELFPFLQRDNSNDRMHFLQSLLKRKTAPISDSALNNDHLNSDATAPYPNSIAIDDSSDDEQVTNLMQDVDNLSKVPPFNILDSETRRSDVSLHFPPKANPKKQRKNVDFFASFSPTASYVTIRLVLALTALPHWYGVDLDATSAFISAPLPPEERVYLKGIPGYDLPKGKCLRLKKTIYGLVQAPLSYFKLCKEVYAKVGVRQLDCDECVFVKYSQNIKGQPPLSVENIIESGAFMTMDTERLQLIRKLTSIPYSRNTI
jgi:hypothetical protein